MFDPYVNSGVEKPRVEWSGIDQSTYGAIFLLVDIT